MIASLRRCLIGLASDIDVMSIALAIAIAWAFLQLTSAVSQFVTVALSSGSSDVFGNYGFLSMNVGGHLFESVCSYRR